MYIVEGNIGAGKSTFLKLLHKYLPGIEIIFEPLHTWHTDTSGASLLTAFYNDPHRWAYTIETLTMLYRVKEHLKEQHITQGVRIMERSIYSGYYCFAQNSYNNGFLTAIEWSLYSAWVDFLTHGNCKPPKGFVYLQTKPDIAFARIQKRQRSGEQQISLAYLEQLHNCHERFLVEKTNIPPELQKVPVLLLDCNEDFEHNPALFQEHTERIKEFVGITEPTKLTITVPEIIL
jgi:deoxyadenosine/deoxycytidine kinase